MSPCVYNTTDKITEILKNIEYTVYLLHSKNMQSVTTKEKRKLETPEMYKTLLAVGFHILQKAGNLRKVQMKVKEHVGLKTSRTHG